MSAGLGYDIVIPTVARPSLVKLIDRLAAAAHPLPGRIVVVDDRPRPAQGPLRLPSAELDPLIRVIRSGGRGPAAARNVGWRSCASPWVVFLDDDVLPGPEWGERLSFDLDAPPDMVGSQARLEVPLPGHRAPTDWERNVAGLATAHWATADMAYRRWALELLGGFDERFRGAYREDADLALRAIAAGLSLRVGSRTTAHPPGPERFLGSIARQRGNQDDPVMSLVHGRGWRRRAGVTGGRRPLHLLTTAAALAAGFGSGGRRALARALLGGLIAQFAWTRLRKGPRTIRETTDMLVTSVVIPFVATLHWLLGWWRGLKSLGHGGSLSGPAEALPANITAVLFDRDGTLIRDVPYNGDPALVEPMPGSVEVVDRLRRHGVLLGVVSNQSAVGRGLIGEADVQAVNCRVDDLFGGFDDWQVCPHRAEDDCGCRKPGTEMILRTVARLGVDPAQCVMVGDIGSDVESAQRAGCGHVLVPTAKTLPDEVASASNLAADLDAFYVRVLPHLGGAA